MAVRLVDGLEQIFSNLGLVGSGFKLNFYETGDTTRKDTYSNAALSVVNPNPVLCDASGRPEYDVWGLGKSSYKLVLTDANDVEIKTIDPIDSGESGSIISLNPLPVAYWGVTTGSSSAYTLNPALVPITNYSNTQNFLADIHVTCGDSPSFSINGLDPLSLKKKNLLGAKVDLVAGDLLAGNRYLFENDGVDLIVPHPENPANAKKATKSSFGLAQLLKTIEISNSETDPNNDIKFSEGNFIFDDGSGQAYYAGGTGQLDANFGTDDGMLDTGSVAIDTWYYLYMVYDPIAEDAKPLATVAYGSPTLPSEYTKSTFLKKAVLTDSSGNIIQGKWFEDNYFEYNEDQILYSDALGATQEEFSAACPSLVYCRNYGSANAVETSLNVANAAIIKSKYKGNIGTIDDTTATILTGTDADASTRPVKNSVEWIRITEDSQLYAKATSTFTSFHIKQYGYKIL